MTEPQSHQHEMSEEQASAMFEPPSWEERYAGEEKIWSGRPNPQLVAEVASLPPGTALDVGCGEGGDVIWLAQQGWHVTGADFSANGLARAARHAEEAGVADRTDWWQVDARTFEAGGRTFDLVTTHFLHPPDGGIVDVVRRLAEAVAPGGHLLVVGHAPSEVFHQLSASHRGAMWLSADLLPGLPDDLEPVVVEERARTAERDGVTMEIEDATLLARRRASAVDHLLETAREGLDRVRAEDLAAEVAAGALLVDTRPVEQRERDGEMPGAIVVDRNVLEWRLDPTSANRLPVSDDPDRRIVLLCNEGYSSSLAARSLRDLGLTRATDLVGGYQAWLALSGRRAT